MDALLARLAAVRGTEVRVRVVPTIGADRREEVSFADLQSEPGTLLDPQVNAPQRATVTARDTLGNEIFFDHLYQIGSIGILRCRAGCQPFRVEIRPSTQLINAFGDFPHVHRFFRGVFITQGKTPS